MEANTTLLEFRVPAAMLQDPVSCKTSVQEIYNQLKAYGFKEGHTLSDVGNGCCFFVQYITNSGSHASLRGQDTGLITLDIHEYVDQQGKPTFTQEITDVLKTNISSSLKAEKSFMLPAIKRGGAINCYFPTTDGKLIEYDFDKLVFEQTSDYQNIKIFHSPQFGNMLILDDDPNLAESDLLYTQAITGHGREDYRGKTVLILGGGDGGILHELRKEQPASITMVDIDGVVVEAARKHLRGICHDSLDQLKGDAYEVLIADCVPILQEYVKTGRQFDFVINDLTAVPVTTEPVGDHWDFLRLILDLSMKVLAPGGKYYTQGNGANMTSALAMYEAQLGRLETPVHFHTQSVYVPSYHELWVFYEIWKRANNGEKVPN